MDVNRTEAIKNLLTHKTHNDLANLYSAKMECQVNVAQDGGERVEGEYKGKQWRGWSDGLETWKAFRIPYKAYSNPEYTDRRQSFDLAKHAEGVGMTGWDWVNRCSRWVAYDFDAIVGHSAAHQKKLSNDEMQRVKDAAFGIPWVTVRKSTSGSGLHLYVFLDDVPTVNHNEHAALSRAILGMMAAITGYDFESKVDVCGGNMWVWHRKMVGTDGLTLLKAGTTLTDIPPNWHEHLSVITGTKRRTNLNHDTEVEDDFEALINQMSHQPLDDTHKKLIDHLTDTNVLWWWDQDRHMLVTHTKHLETAFNVLKMKGYFATNSDGNNTDEQNCFCYPMRRGGWSVRRFTRGAGEHISWTQDNAGWTRCYLNIDVDFKTACRATGGLEDSKGQFVFRTGVDAIKACKMLGIAVESDPAVLGRKTVIKKHKDGRMLVIVDHDANDQADKMTGWLADKGKWSRFYTMQAAPVQEQENTICDDLVRHLVTTSDEDYGWVIKRGDTWGTEPISNIKIALTSLGVSGKDSSSLLGNSVLKPWQLVNKPFQDEYLGDRRWNRDAAQLKYKPSAPDATHHCPTWDKILKHCGHGLNIVVAKDPWCKSNGVTTGSDYLRLWIASLFQRPERPLPYLFLYSPEQNTGKSSFHEALDLLFLRGYMRGDTALTNESSFNKELDGMCLCVLEELNLNKNQRAYNRIKDWVTSRKLLIHPKGGTPYHITNTTHWVHCSNDYSACPVFPGDTRITMVRVPPLDVLDLIPKPTLERLLVKEAEDFLATVMNIEIPDSLDRLSVPVLHTSEKKALSELNKTPVEVFLTEFTQACPGSRIKFTELYDRFYEWVDPDDARSWGKINVARAIAPLYPKGRQRKDAQHYIGNICWKDDVKEPSTPLVLDDVYLEVQRAT